MRRRLIYAVVVVVVLVVAAVALYLWAGPVAQDAQVPVGLPEGIDLGSFGPLFEMPGCVCHSDDPEVVEEHSHYRLQDCADCH